MSSEQKNAQKKAEEFAEKLKEAYKREFVFLLMGRTGVGKSSTINQLMGHKVAEINELEPQTMLVCEYRLPIANVNFLVVDTPGLCDDLPEKGNDLQYLQQVKKKIKYIDCLLYTTRLNEPRVGADEKHGIHLITNVFGEKVWNNSVIVFTFADMVKPDRYEYTLKERSRLIREAIRQKASESIVKKIPSVAVDNTSLKTPDGQEWLGELYTTVVQRISADGFIQYLMATSPNVIHEPKIIEKPVYVDRPVYQKPEIVEKPVYVDRPVYIDRPVYVEQPIRLNEEQIGRIQYEIEQRGFTREIIEVGIKLAVEATKAVVETAVYVGEKIDSAVNHAVNSVKSAWKKFTSWF